MMERYGKLKEDFVLQPISGKALPVYKGEVLRITQEEGGQCVDFNAFNLHDYREFMDTSIMRRQNFHLDKGHFLITNSPRNRLMMQILEKSPENVLDVLASRCSAALYEAVWGVDRHSNCQDSLAEAIGEYGLTPDDTHAAFCPWMRTNWDESGKINLGDNRQVKKGDHLDILALMDVLTASCICGSADYLVLGNYFPRPVRLQVFESSAETKALVEEISRRFPPLVTQRKPEDYRVKRGRDADFELKQVPGYEPEFINFPLKTETVEVELDEGDYEQVREQVAAGLREDDADAVRWAVMEWYFLNRTTPHPVLGQLG